MTTLKKLTPWGSTELARVLNCAHGYNGQGTNCFVDPSFRFDKIYTVLESGKIRTTVENDYSQPFRYEVLLCNTTNEVVGICNRSSKSLNELKLVNHPYTHLGYVLCNAHLLYPEQCRDEYIMDAEEETWQEHMYKLTMLTFGSIGKVHFNKMYCIDLKSKDKEFGIRELPIMPNTSVFCDLIRCSNGVFAVCHQLEIGYCAVWPESREKLKEIERFRYAYKYLGSFALG
jgi:hypothetical protein